MKYVVISLYHVVCCPFLYQFYHLCHSLLAPFQHNLTLAAIRNNDEEIPILQRLGCRRRLHDPRTRTGKEEDAYCAHEP
jgi:hypothetical protein